MHSLGNRRVVEIDRPAGGVQARGGTFYDTAAVAGGKEKGRE
jgi:hypothetical protein